MKSIKANLLKIKSACEEFGKRYLMITRVITFLNMAFFGNLLLFILEGLVRLSRSADEKWFLNYIFAVYTIGFTIIAGIKLICQPMMSFLLQSSFEGQFLRLSLKMAHVWRNITIGQTIAQLIFTTIIPQWPFLDEIVTLLWAYMVYHFITYRRKLMRQQEAIFAMEGVAPWA